MGFQMQINFDLVRFDWFWLNSASTLWNFPCKIVIAAFFLLGLTTAHADDILYITDLEGSRERLEAFYEKSGGFVRGPDQRYHIKTDTIIVFGGDAIDRFDHSIWVVEELLRLHQESPTRMFSILGNRDVNKLRLAIELTPKALSHPPLKFSFTKEAAYIEILKAGADPVARLKYILSHTMGADQAFEFYRVEIATRTHRPVHQVSDFEVSKFFVDFVKPGGALLELLKYMRPALRIGNNLFLHGGATQKNIGYVPDADLAANSLLSVDLNFWISHLNGWYLKKLAEYEYQFDSWSGEGPRPIESLLNYPMPLAGGSVREDSTVTARHVDGENNPMLPDPQVVHYLKTQGVHRELVGHNPVGEIPVLARSEDGTFESVFADTSRSSRQDRVGWVRLKGPDYIQTEVHGFVQLAGHSWVGVHGLAQIGVPHDLGTLVPEKGRVVGVTSDGEIIATQMLKFKIENKVVGWSRACSNFFKD